MQHRPIAIHAQKRPRLASPHPQHIQGVDGAEKQSVKKINKDDAARLPGLPHPVQHSPSFIPFGMATASCPHTPLATIFYQNARMGGVDKTPAARIFPASAF
ncbi:MAG: hypothetical protein LBT53_03455 [Puniceicoccales bacterium]|nr:hypothetical protein [Puniceicoccales bacterium]